MRSCRAFGLSLIELLIVLTILAVLAALLFPVITAAQRSGPRSQCISNLHQLGLAFDMYAQDFERARPHSLEQLHPSYVTERSLLVCPADPWDDRGGWYGLLARTTMPPAMQPSMTLSYGYFGLLANRDESWAEARATPGRPGYVACVVHGERCGLGEAPPFYSGQTLRLCFDGSVAAGRTDYPITEAGHCQLDIWLVCTGQQRAAR